MSLLLEERCNGDDIKQHQKLTKGICVITCTSRVPVEGISSVCLNCMKYRILFLIIIIISLGQILLSYIANTSRTHARTPSRTYARTPSRTHGRKHARTDACTYARTDALTRVHTPPHTHTHTAVAVSLFDGSVPANRDGPLRW